MRLHLLSYIDPAPTLYFPTAILCLHLLSYIDPAPTLYFPTAILCLHSTFLRRSCAYTLLLHRPCAYTSYFPTSVMRLHLLSYIDPASTIYFYIDPASTLYFPTRTLRLLPYSGGRRGGVVCVWTAILVVTEIVGSNLSMSENSSIIRHATGHCTDQGLRQASRNRKIAGSSPTIGTVILLGECR